MPDYYYAKPLRGEFSRGLVDSLDKGTGRVYDADTPRLRRLPYLRRYTMRRKEHRRTVRNLGETFYECESALLQFIDDNLVMDEFVKAV